MKNTPLNKRSRKNNKIKSKDRKYQKAIVERDGICIGKYICEGTKTGCLYNPFDREYLIVHHVLSKKSHPEYRYTLENGITVHSLCHIPIFHDNTSELRREIYDYNDIEERIDEMISLGGTVIE